MQNTPPEQDWQLPGRLSCAVAGGLALCVFAGLLPFVPASTAAFTAYLFLVMALITLIDLRHFIIPDALSLPAIPMGILAHATALPGGDWLQAVTGACVGGGAFLLLRTIYFRLRSIEGLGLGDVKLAAMAGAWLGTAPLAPACLTASLAGVAVVLIQAARGSGVARLNARMQLPFGSFIAPAIFVFWLAQLLETVPFWQGFLLFR